PRRHVSGQRPLHPRAVKRRQGTHRQHQQRILEKTLRRSQAGLKYIREGAMKLARVVAASIAFALAPSVSVFAAGPDHVDITWMSIANIHYQMGSFGVLTDGYITRIPESQFHGGG